MAATPQEAVDIAAQAGFQYIEIPVTTWSPLTNPETATQNEIAAIQEILTSSGVEASSLGMIWPPNYMMVTRSPTYWTRNLNYAQKLFDFSAALGVTVMNLGGPQVRSVPVNVPYYEGLKTLVRFWQAACRHAEDVGSPLASNIS